ncbi:acyltransferase [Bacillus sp. NP157]|nr:acyltransferase [Bacillus sp. NP157]
MTRLPGLDTLRAVAVAWVMLFHSYLVGGLGENFGLLERAGWMGVDLFFVLSGFLIGSQVFRGLRDGGSLDLRAFYARRAARILPAFLVVLGLYVAWPAWRETPQMQPAWQFLTFTFNLWFDAPDRYAFSHAWSLCVEEHFYLLFPLLALLLARRMTTRRFVASCLLVVLGGIVLRGVLWQAIIGPRIGTDLPVGPPFLQFLYYPTYARLDGLVAGVALAACAVYRPVWLARAQARGGLLLLGSAVLLGACIALCEGRRLGFWPNTVGYPLIALAMAGFVAAGAGGTWLARWRIPGAGWLARASYSLYLSHKGAFMLAEAAMGGRLDTSPVLRFMVFVVVVLAVGATLHYTVERPFLRWRERRSATLRGSSPAQGNSVAVIAAEAGMPATGQLEP